jgi:hypothetical protein
MAGKSQAFQRNIFQNNVFQVGVADRGTSLIKGYYAVVVLS